MRAVRQRRVASGRHLRRAAPPDAGVGFGPRSRGRRAGHHRPDHGAAQM